MRSCLALDAVENAKQSQAWVRQRSGEVGVPEDTSPENEPFFKEALDIKPIGEMLGRRVEGGRALVGSDWFVASRNYGYWLGMVGRGSTAESSSSPRSKFTLQSERAQLELALTISTRRTLRAQASTLRWQRLAPGDTDVAVMRGAVALASRDRKARSRRGARS